MDETMDSVTDARTARREEWRRVIAAQQTSGQKAATFCRERGIPVWKFSYWRKALADGDAPGFVQMRVSTARETRAQVWVDAGRWRVYVTPGFDAATLRRTVEALAGP